MTKKILIIAATILMSIGTLMADNDRIIDQKELPVKAKEFISTYFSNENVTYAKLDKDIFENRYEVYLKNGVKITFFKNGEWKEVDAESASVTFEMPEGLIPIQLRQYVEANYTGIRIKSIEKDGRFTDVSLANGLDLRFDSNYRLVNIDD
ncbi:MAG: PepSY-like domain-containing protein [Bacteroidales bacterium]|nr:PepSY-like domain-containing protein [Bacteroidales bacterium]MBO7284772.1 PepSY-like domain-containing protein [Bacteroidales bacterium]MBO7322197.1 PepSY-like domain-containing protein [Bacteroidales bacterium]